MEQLKALISQKTGLVMRSDDETRFREVISSRVKQGKHGGPHEYYLRLNARTAHSEQEWKKLLALLTVGESFFFRDKGQFGLLRHKILPDLLSQRRIQRSLKIWSAGCATGEEPYSIAAVIDELLPERANWKILILGTDINGEAVEKARQGMFSGWSLRGMDPQLRQKYFRRHGDSWQISERIRDMVEFRVGNLLDPPPDFLSGLDRIDLVVCRNVFIYFHQEAIRHVIRRFGDLLNERGYLIVGHGELFGHEMHLAHLKTLVFDESVVYQKITPNCSPGRSIENVDHVPPTVQSKSPSPARGAKPLTRRPAAARNKGETDRKTTAPATSSAHSEMERLFRMGDYQAVIKIGEQLARDAPRDFSCHQMLAHAYANIGLYENAAENCRRMIRMDSASATPYLLLAAIAEAQEDREEAKKLLRKVIYIDPTCVAAYLELGGLYDGEGHTQRARKMRKAAVELLDALPPDTVLEHCAYMTAGELRQRLTDTKI